MPGTEHDAVAAAMRRVLRDHGWLAATNPGRLRAGLNDVLASRADEVRRIVDAVVISAEEGVATEVRAAGPQGLAAVAPELVARLVDWGMAEEQAAWVVDAWGALLPPATLDPPQSPQTPAPPAAAIPGSDSGARQVSAHRATSPEPTTLPGEPPAAPFLAPTLLPPAQPGSAWEASGASTSAPAEPASGPATKTRRIVLAGVAALVVMAAGVAGGTVLLGGDDDDPAGAGDRDVAALPAAAGTELVADGGVSPSWIPSTAMASLNTGVALTALSEVDSFTGPTGEEVGPPAGGKLIGFTVGNWGCARDNRADSFDDSGCEPWHEAGLVVDVDADRRTLPVTGDADADTFVVAVPAGTGAVDLVLQQDGHRQTLSLLDGRPGRENIAVLARPGLYQFVNRRFSVRERTSVALDFGDGQGRTTTRRDIEVLSAELKYFVGDGQTPSSPDRALLEVRAYYDRPQDPDADIWYFRSDEVRLRDGSGRVHAPVRLRGTSGSPGEPWYSEYHYFDVPAGISRATLLLGGTISEKSTTGVPYTDVTPVRRVKLAFGG